MTKSSLLFAIAVVALATACEHSGDEKAECEGRCVSTFAGSGKPTADDGPAADAGFYLPKGLAVAPDGGVYVADTSNHRIRLIKDDAVTTVAGTGEAGFADGAAEAARFSSPSGIALGADGTIYVADQGNHRVRAIRAGQVTTLAGSGEQGFADGPAANARFFAPTGVAVDAAGAVYVADFGNHRVRAIRAGAVDTVLGGDEGFSLGTRAATRLRNPLAVAVGADGAIYVSDTGNQRVLKLVGDAVAKVAGKSVLDAAADRSGVEDEPAGIALAAPAGLAVGRDGVYVADWFRHRVFRLRDGAIAAVVGKADKAEDAPDSGAGVAGFADGEPAKAKLAAPFAVAFDREGALLVADAKNNRVRRLTAN